LGQSTDFVSGASGLSTSGSAPFVISSGSLGVSDSLTFNPKITSLSLGALFNQFELRPMKTHPFGVMQVRSTRINSPTAWDLFPNSDASRGAWIDVCNDDLIANPVANWRCLAAYALPNAYFLGVHHANWTATPSKPLYIGGKWLEFRANGPFWGHSTGRLEDGALTLFDSSVDLPYMSIIKSDGRLRLTSGMQVTWSSTGSVYDSNDAGLVRSTAGAVKITNGSTGYGLLDAGGYSSIGTPGLTKSCVGSIASLTINGGLVTFILCGQLP